MKREVLERYGWKPIVSDRHAYTLLRRELKHHARSVDAGCDLVSSFRYLLGIKKGNYYKFLNNKENRYASILIWRMKEKGVT